MIIISVQIIAAQLQSVGAAGGNPSAYGKLRNNNANVEAVTPQQRTSTTGFVCTGRNTYTSYDEINGLENQSCPSGYYCNKKCVNPCTAEIRFC
jgi:hypothetical protein